MVTINLAYTAPINPPGATPVLSPEQVWAGLKRKVRHAEEFVPVITSCKVLSEEGDTVTREATFVKEDGFPPEPNREVCIHYEPTRIDFHQPNGSTISNIVSNGPDGELIMTYVFEWKDVDVVAGSDAEKELRAKYHNGAKMAVEGSINTIRRLVIEGEI